MSDKEHQFKSLNKETGLLEDIDETRVVGLAMVHTLQNLLMSPMVRLTTPPGVFIDMVLMAVLSEARLRVLPEADMVRLLSGLLGAGPLEVEDQIREFHLSEKLPPTHPDAVTQNTDFGPLDPENPIVKNSKALQRMMASDKQQKKEPRVELPPTLEAFLKELQQEDKPEGE